MMRIVSEFKLLVGFLIGVVSFSSLADIQSQTGSAYEPAILEIVTKIQEGHLESALTAAEAHIEEFPKSRIGHLLRADILQAMVSNPLAVQNSKAAPRISNPVETTEGIRHQLKNRWHHHTAGQALSNTKVPASLIDMGRHQYVLVADMHAGRLYLYENQNGEPELIRDYYLTVGSEGYGKEFEGDNKTPIGVYSIYRHIDGSELPDLYGKGAYPVNYPNVYDRAQKRTGYGIWLHGTPSNTYARSPWASEGCFVLSNSDLADIEQFIDVEGRTPVVLAESIEWISQEELESRRTSLSKAIADWRQDWESLDTDAYLKHYSQEYFNFGTANFDRWAKQKFDTNSRKTFIQIDLSIDGLFMYPGEQNMFVVYLSQNYLSNNFASQSQKQQFWRRESSGAWKIVYEG